MVCGAALDRDGDDLTCHAVGVFLRLGFDFLDLERGVVAALVFQTAEDLVLGLVLRQTGDLFQHFQLALFDEGDLLLRGEHGRLTLPQLLLLAFKGVRLFVEGLLLLLQAALLLLQVCAALPDFAFVFGTVFMNFFLGFHQHLALFVLAALDRLVDDATGFVLCAGDLAFGDLLAVDHADEEE